MKHHITLKSLDINPNIYFFGTNEAIEAAERKEQVQADIIKNIISAPDFIALEYRTKSGARRILHRSTRCGVLWQLSYIAADGVPTMHENYISIGRTEEHTHTAAELYRHFVNLTLNTAQELTILNA